MKFKALLKLSFFIISLAGITFSLIVFLLFLNLPVLGSYMKPISSANRQTLQNLIKNKLFEPAQAIASGEKAGLEIPIRLKIPKIKIDTALESVGLTANGAVGVPKSSAKAAWYNLGPRPGEKGSAIITGHYGRWKNGEGSVFDNLSKLKKGDKLYIKDKKGNIITFVVRDSRSYTPKEYTPEVFISNDDKSHLNLITCEGNWNKISKSYPKRLVIFSDKE